ncbi:hypothetical protein [Streptomyces capillispiralis]|uniref:Uncharacterized protein n=1 Tax=Streptomyces capillispiralis TaxID=68182 RepID=A0A561TRK4_9ACTN|nr:hypothetical protein [Streptomyces capillispiralis]TWF89749.1 hypothetical protein FHX78_116792 [Streptomyces capillispiralis]GHH94071.1 hypothetical protein GCM10017779_45280 [Streptomyces capillispiralis]
MPDIERDVCFFLIEHHGSCAVVETAGGFEAQLAELEALDAYRGSNYTALVERFFKPDRPTKFKIARRLSFTATSTDRSVLDALDHVLARQYLPRPLVADTHPTRMDENDGPHGRVPRPCPSGSGFFRAGALCH